MDTEIVKEDAQKEGTACVPQQETAAAAPPKPQDPVKRQRRDERNRRDDRNYESFMKAVHAAPPSEQLNIASQKYLAIFDEYKKMQFYIKQSDKRHAIVMKEKEQLQLEFNKAILVKSKLENLCRELQKQNKSIKDDSLHKIREEEEKRKETQAKFQSSLAEVSAVLQHNNEKNAKLRDDNIDMTEKFKTLVDQYQIREDQVAKMSRQMELESQLNAAKMQKASLEHQAERERLIVEMETLKMAVVEYRSKINEMQGTESGLRGQLNLYTDKYDEFQSALMKSNKVFGGFKDQIGSMSKKIKVLEKESLSWKQRWETSQSALLEMCSERQSADLRLGALQRQLAHMQSLCRTLQSERTVLLNTLKEHDIERPPLPAPAPAPPAPERLPSPPPAKHSAASDAKVDAMAANCAQLRQSLAHLQSQLNVLTTQQTEEPAQPEKPKKSKNKKKSKKIAVEESKATTEDAADDKSEEGTTKIVAEEESKETTENPADDKSVEVGAEIVTEAKKTDTTAIEESTDTKETAPTVEPITSEVESVDLPVEKVDENVLDSLMNAINISNVSLLDLEVVDNSKTTIEAVVEAKIEEITDSETKDLKVTQSKDNNAKENGVVEIKELATPKKENLDVPITPEKAESPKSSPKKVASPKLSPKKNASPKDSPKKIAEDKGTILEPVKSNLVEKKDSKSENCIDGKIKKDKIEV